MEKKQRFIYWFIGLGCGMMLSGLVMTFVGLNLKVEGEDTNATVVGIAPVFETQEQGALRRDTGEHSLEEEVEQDQTIKNTGETKEAVGEGPYKWVRIPEAYSATQISKLLEKEGIIEDASDFGSYISTEKMTTKLRCGQLYLPVKGAYDTLLTILTTDNLN